MKKNGWVGGRNIEKNGLVCSKNQVSYMDDSPPLRTLPTPKPTFKIVPYQPKQKPFKIPIPRTQTSLLSLFLPQYFVYSSITTHY